MLCPQNGTAVLKAFKDFMDYAANSYDYIKKTDANVVAAQ